MTLFHQDGQVSLYLGDSAQVLASLLAAMTL